MPAYLRYPLGRLTWPLRSGDLELSFKYLMTASFYGFYWSPSRATNATKAYGPAFHVSYVGPSNGPGNRYHGYSLRCPQEYVRSGYITRLLGYLGISGLSGYYWSSSRAAATVAYGLAFNSSGVYPSNGPGTRCSGFSLRCLQK